MSSIPFLCVVGGGDNAINNSDYHYYQRHLLIPLIFLLRDIFL